MNRSHFRPIRAKSDKLLTTAVFLAVVVGMRVFSIPCIFYSVTGLPCPTCGMTRAWIALLHFDIPAAFSFHPLFWTIPLFYLCFLYDGQLFKTKVANAVFYTVFAVAFIVYWCATLYRCIFL